MISIDAPFRISEEFRALGVCLLMHTSRAACTSTGTSLILPSSRLSLHCGPMAFLITRISPLESPERPRRLRRRRLRGLHKPMGGAADGPSTRAVDLVRWVGDHRVPNE